MNMNIKDYYYHTLSKDDSIKSLEVFDKVLKDNKLKSQNMLGNKKIKFNGLDYISLAFYIDSDNFDGFIINENDFNKSDLSKIFDNYFEYLNYMNLDKNIFKPISREKFFEENHTNDKKEYYKYLDSITRTYPIDIQYLYNKTHDVVYKYILDKINRNILYCYKSDNCFDLYIRNSKGITLMFHKSIDTVNVNIIPNLPSNIEEYLVEKISNLEVRYSNMSGEVQVKDYIDIKDCVGVIISNNININDVKSIINKNNENIKIYKLVNNELIEIDN